MIAITADLLTHVKTIDEQHQKLIEHLNNVELLGTKSHTQEETEKALNFLGDYIIEHFSNEEALMLESNYPKYDWHHNWHQSYIAKFQLLQDEYIKNGPSDEFSHILNEFLIKWILTHIKNVDVALGAHIKEHLKI